MAGAGLGSLEPKVLYTVHLGLGTSTRLGGPHDTTERCVSSGRLDVTFESPAEKIDTFGKSQETERFIKNST